MELTLFFFSSWRQSLLLHSMETKRESNLCKLHVLFCLNHVPFTHSNESLGIKWTVTMNGESTSGLCFSRIISTCCISFWPGTTRGETLLSAPLHLRDCSSSDFHCSWILLTAGAEGGASWAVIKAASHSSQILATEPFPVLILRLSQQLASLKREAEVSPIPYAVSEKWLLKVQPVWLSWAKSAAISKLVLFVSSRAT